MVISIISVVLIVYFIIGAIVANWIWIKHYEQQYEEAKKSEEGVEEGMATILLTFLFIFWPFALIYNFLK